MNKITVAFLTLPMFLACAAPEDDSTGSFEEFSVDAQNTRDTSQIRKGQEPIFVHLNGCEIDFEVPPVIVNSRTFVELNALFTALDIGLSWNQAEQKVTGRAPNGKTIELFIGSRDAFIDGFYVGLDEAPFVSAPENRTMIPLSFVAIATGATVDWINDPRTVDIKSNRSYSCSVNTASDMAEYMWRGYLPFGEAGPISLVFSNMHQDGTSRPVYLIGLSGTDTARVDQDGDATGILEDLIIGGWNGDNDYKSAVINVLLHHVPQGSNIVLAGHSLGGMVAQQVAGNKWVKDNYRVLHTITLGSPRVNPNGREGEVRRLGDVVDPVPLLGSGVGNSIGLNRERSGIINPLKAHVLSYRLERIWDKYDAVGRNNGNTSFLFSTSQVRHFSAPRI